MAAPATNDLKVDVTMPDFPTPPPTSETGKSTVSDTESTSSSSSCSDHPSTLHHDVLAAKAYASLLGGVSTPSSVVHDFGPDHTSSGEKIKRPMNAFMVWAQMRRAEITANSSKVHNSLISKALGVEWREMNDDQKAPFVQKAKELRDELFREHPNYVYRPRKRKAVRGRADEVATPAKMVSTLSLPTSSPSLPPSMVRHSPLGAFDIDFSSLKSSPSHSPEAAALLSSQLPLLMYQPLLSNPLLLTQFLQAQLQAQALLAAVAKK